MKPIERLERLQLILSAAKAELQKAGKSAKMHAILRNAFVLGSKNSSRSEKARATAALNELARAGIALASDPKAPKQKREMTQEEKDEAHDKFIRAVRSKDQIGIERGTKKLLSAGFDKEYIDKLYSSSASLLPDMQEKAVSDIANNVGGEAGKRIQQGFSDVKNEVENNMPRQSATVDVPSAPRTQNPTPKSAIAQAPAAPKQAQPKVIRKPAAPQDLSWVKELGASEDEYHTWTPKQQAEAKKLHTYKKSQGQL